MIDIALETVRALILLGIVLFLWRVGRKRFDATRKGWNLIVAGFGLLLFGSLIDITDNFEDLNRFVVVAVLVNIFAGINRCDWVAEGVVQAFRQADIKVPVIVRLAGTNVEEGKKIIADSGLPIITADTLADAAQKSVAALAA